MRFPFEGRKDISLVLAQDGIDCDGEDPALPAAADDNDAGCGSNMRPPRVR